MEIEVPNPGFRLKPGMYARVRLTAGRKAECADGAARGRRRRRQPARGVRHRRRRRALQASVTGLSDLDRVEVLDGLTEGTRVVTTGALAIRDGDRVAVTRREAAAAEARRSSRWPRCGRVHGRGQAPHGHRRGGAAESRSATASAEPAAGRRRRAGGRAAVGRVTSAAVLRSLQEFTMSIPRLAIERPVTMFMLSAVVVLLGVMSLARLPVDLMPDISYPADHGSRRVRAASARRRSKN